jgi:hypothetical protein
MAPQDMVRRWRLDGPAAREPEPNCVEELMVLARRLAVHVAGGLAAAFFAATAIPAASASGNDYPTVAKVDYVIGCMASNGQNYLVMQKCACSIDAIAETIAYDHYERVETILRMREGRGELSLMFRTSPALEEDVQAFKQAQIEADLRKWLISLRVFGG